MKSGAIVCFVMAALATIIAVNNIIGGANRPEGIENLVGYAVGAFLLPIAFLIGGLVLLDKSKKT
jgi:nucleoside permease NupC